MESADSVIIPPLRCSLSDFLLWLEESWEFGLRQRSEVERVLAIEFCDFRFGGAVEPRCMSNFFFFPSLADSISPSPFPNGKPPSKIPFEGIIELFCQNPCLPRTQSALMLLHQYPYEALFGSLFLSIRSRGASQLKHVLSTAPKVTL